MRELRQEPLLWAVAMLLSLLMVPNPAMRLILLCTLAALAGLPIGYALGWLVEETERRMEAYVRGSEQVFVGYVCAEMWR